MSAMTETSASVSMGEQLWGRPEIGNGRAILIYTSTSFPHSLLHLFLDLSNPFCTLLSHSHTFILAPTPGQEGSDDKSGLIAGVVIGITVVAIVTPAILVISAYFMYTKHKEQKKREAL